MFISTIINTTVNSATKVASDVTRIITSTLLWMIAIFLAYIFRTCLKIWRSLSIGVGISCLVLDSDDVGRSIQVLTSILILDFVTNCLELANIYVRYCQKTSVWSLNNVSFSKTKYVSTDDD